MVVYQDSLSECVRFTIEGLQKDLFLFQSPLIVAAVITGTGKTGTILCIYKITIVLPVNLFTIEKIIKACYIIRKVMKLQECSLWKKTVQPVLTS